MDELLGNIEHRQALRHQQQVDNLIGMAEGAAFGWLLAKIFGEKAAIMIMMTPVVLGVLAVAGYLVYFNTIVRPSHAIWTIGALVVCAWIVHRLRGNPRQQGR
jgi:hypothetical protein